MTRAPKKTTARKRHRFPGPKWLLVRCKSGQENYARLNAERQGYQVYLPRWQPRGVGRLAAWFPGYMFVRIDGMPWAPLRSTYGVMDIITGIVPPKALKTLRDLQNDEGIIRSPEQRERDEQDKLTRTKLSPGDQVTGTRGAFKGIDAVYKGVNPDHRIDIVLTMMGHPVTVTVDRKDVASKPKPGKA